MTEVLTPATVLASLSTRPRLLAVGEPTHGAAELWELRTALFAGLVEQGYRTIALETDCLAALAVDDYVRGGPGDLDAVVRRGFSHEWGAYPANRELVRWMRAHNEGRPPADRVRFAGCDGPLEITHAASPRRTLLALHEHLATRIAPALLPCTAERLDALLGADERWTEPAAMVDPSRSVGRAPEAGELRLIADDLVALLDEQTPDLVEPAADWERARLWGRTAVGLLRYHWWMADTSPGRLGRLLGVRDSMMAATLLALADRGRTFVYAHNAHLQRPRSSMRMGGAPVEWWSAGAIVSAHLGEEYAYLATAVGSIRDRGVGAPPPDTLEGLLSALPGERLLVDPRELDLRSVSPRVSPWFGYAPFDPAHTAAVDGIVFVRDC
ncbi:erythromycin esterase family protein [Pseudonocardia xishanensis]|uniref:Erythromycin esterase family protein n=1 Tax=Pseudonocardia xishanensis TaxID=630995 RepID=A0ABP8RMK1_9PSEU